MPLRERANDSFEEVLMNLHNYTFCETKGWALLSAGVLNLIKTATGGKSSLTASLVP